MMLSCLQATRLISNSMVSPLPWKKRVQLRIHLVFCDYCARFEKQCLWMMIVAKRHMYDSERDIQGECLSDEARDRIRQALNKDTE